MKLKDQIRAIAQKSEHQYMAMVTTPTTEQAKAIASKVANPKLQTAIITETHQVPETNVEKMKIGKLVSEQDGTKRHKATCEVVLSYRTEVTTYLIFLTSSRAIRRHVEQAVRTKLEWHPRTMALEEDEPGTEAETDPSPKGGLDPVEEGPKEPV